MVSQNADDFAAALGERDKAMLDGQMLTSRKNMLISGNPFAQGDGSPRQQPVQQRPQGVQQPMAPAPLPRVVQQHVEDFMDENPWYNPNDRLANGKVRDFDTRIMLEIDSDLAAEGFDPSSQDYWEELRDRGRERLPHRFADDAPAQQPQRQAARAPQQRQAPVDPIRRGPPAAGGMDRGPAAQAGKNQLYLSPQRKEALIAAGVLNRDGKTVEDPVKFRRLADQYIKFDATNGVARS
jgi:hypothetical protein